MVRFEEMGFLKSEEMNEDVSLLLGNIALKGKSPFI
jgi:hypothetical protein